MSEPKTLVDLLRTERSGEQRLGFFEKPGQYRWMTVDELRAAALRRLGDLERAGVTRGQEVVMPVDDPAAFVEIFWACQLGGLVGAALLPEDGVGARLLPPDPCEEDPRKLQLPFETETGELIEERWQRWLSWDPVEMVASHVSALKSLRYLYLDCGFRDQYRLHHGARIMSSRLKDHEIAHHYEEFDDDHSSIQYRYDHSLPALVKSLLP